MEDRRPINRVLGGRASRVLVLPSTGAGCRAMRFVSGGKLTTFRLIALDALAAARSRLPEARDTAFSARAWLREPVHPANLHLSARPPDKTP